MEAFRALLMRHRAMALAVVLAALCIKALVPAGMMVSASSKLLTVQICADASGLDTGRHVAIPMKGDPLGKSAAQGHCAFGALGQAALRSADIVLLALALAFILATGFAPVRVVLHRQTAHLRPPLRGPPVLVG